MKMVANLTQENFRCLLMIGLISTTFGGASIFLAARESDQLSKISEFSIGTFFLVIGAGLFVAAKIAKNHVAVPLASLSSPLNSRLSQRALYGSASSIDSPIHSNA